MSINTLTLLLDNKLKKRLEKLAKSTRRSESSLAAEAIQEFIALNEWQISEIRTAVKEADRDEFASDRQVRTVFNKWK